MFKKGYNLLKESIKKKVEIEKAKARDRAQYQAELNKAVKQARRESYKKEAIKQAQAKARMDAKLKFNPSMSGITKQTSIIPNVKLPMTESPNKKKSKKSKDNMDWIWKS